MEHLSPSRQSRLLVAMLEALPVELIAMISKYTAQDIFGPSAMQDEILGWLQPLREIPILPLKDTSSLAGSLIAQEWLKSTPFYIKLIDTYSGEKLRSVLADIKSEAWTLNSTDDKLAYRLQHLWLRIDCTRASQRILPLFYKIRYHGPFHPFSVDVVTAKVPWGCPEYALPHIDAVRSIIEQKLHDIQLRQTITHRTDSQRQLIEGLSLNDIEEIAAAVLLSTNPNYFGTKQAVRQAWERWERHSFL